MFSSPIIGLADMMAQELLLSVIAIAGAFSMGSYFTIS
jgi:hypothetical protein